MKTVVDWAVVLFLAAVLTLVVLAMVSEPEAKAEFDPMAWALVSLSARCDTLEVAYWVHEARIDRLEASLAERP